MKDRSLHIFLLLSILGILVWSVHHPKDMLNWIGEAIPAILGTALVVIVYPKFRFTNLTYVFLWIDAVIILIGAHYTYVDVPFFEWIQHEFHLSRNHYDRLAHFTLGFTGAYIVGELLVRISPVKKGKLLIGMILSIVLALSALYELAEFLSALIVGGAADSFLGTQGDKWDTQWDILLALCGAILSFLTLGRYYDYLQKIHY